MGARIVVAPLLVLGLASGCFHPDAPPFEGATLAPGPTSGDTLETADSTSTGDDPTSTGADPTAADSTSTSGDPTTDTGSDGESSDGPPEGCGDGMISGVEACDDGNVEPGDGCSEACDEEPGFQCVGQPSTCTPSCGDGIAVAEEGCDDGNATDGDGCTACIVDEGFECTGIMPSVCTSPCGDGVLSGDEACDDGDVMDGNGCAADCTVELYHRCSGAGPGACAPIRIGYLVADDDDAGFRGNIAAITGGPVDYIDARSVTPTLMQLEASHDCVFTHPNFAYADSVGVGTALAAFVDGGSNVVLGIATDYAPSTGLSTSTIMMAAYSPVSTAGNVSFAAVSYAGDGTSAIHTGIAAYGESIYDTGVVLQGMGIQDATYDDGTIAVAYRPDFKVVYLNGTGHMSLPGTGDWGRLVANACAVGFL